MALKFRRGTTAQKSGSLAFGEPYVNTTLGTLQIGLESGDVTLSAIGTGSNISVAGISGSSLDITGNAKIDGTLLVTGSEVSFIGYPWPTEGTETHLLKTEEFTVNLPSGDRYYEYAGIALDHYEEGAVYHNSMRIYMFDDDETPTYGSELLVGPTINYLRLLPSGSENPAQISVGDVQNGTGFARMDADSIHIGRFIAPFISIGNNDSVTVLSGSAIVNSLTGSLSGNASTATTLATARTINGTSFNGSSDITILNLVSGSSQIDITTTTGFSTYSTSVDSRITTEKGRVDAILSAADADKDSFAEIVTLINSIDTSNDGTFASFYTASVGRLNNLESTSASVNISVSNLNTYTGSNDTTNTTQNTRLTALEASASTALSTNNTQATSITNLNSTTASLNTSVSNLNSFSSSALTRLTDLEGKDFSITLTGDVTGTGTVTNLGNVSFATTIAADSIVLGTDTTGNYMTNVSAGTGISVSHTPAEGSTATITNTGVTSNVAGTGVSVSSGTGAVTISIGQSVATNATPTFGNLTINGTITATGDITAYYTSDRRHKNNIKVITNALDKVKKLNGVTWEWNDDVNEVTKSTPTTGLIAQEVQEVLPEVVVERENGYLGLDYSKMMGLLVEAIKEQQIKIDNLTVEVERLKKQKGL